jgi:hypothetical protein
MDICKCSDLLFNLSIILSLFNRLLRIQRRVNGMSEFYFKKLLVSQRMEPFLFLAIQALRIFLKCLIVHHEAIIIVSLNGSKVYTVSLPINPIALLFEKVFHLGFRARQKFVHSCKVNIATFIKIVFH